MEILRHTQELMAWRNSLATHEKIAFVPTMGYFHEGHLSLMREGRTILPQGKVVCSIFVNPTQFGPKEDLASYPRDEAGDLAKAEEAGVDLVFCPEKPQELYAADASTWVEVEGLDQHLCGANRENHFRGVCTVVTKLWNLLQPDIALFGEKDYQQLAILRRLHRDLFLGGEIVSMPIVREGDGLAMSSRNARLDARARQDALALPRYLREVKGRFTQGEDRASVLLRDAASKLSPGRIDYVSLVDAEDLQPVEKIERPSLLASAVFFGGVRLIDNILLRPN